jgi:hypothetical protein
VGNSFFPFGDTLTKRFWGNVVASGEWENNEAIDKLLLSIEVSIDGFFGDLG